MNSCPICGTTKLLYVGITTVECSTPECQNYVPPKPAKKFGGDDMVIKAGTVEAVPCVFSLHDEVVVILNRSAVPPKYVGQFGEVIWISRNQDVVEVEFDDGNTFFFYPSDITFA